MSRRNSGNTNSDWDSMYRDESPALQGYQQALFGGSPEEQARSSPISYAQEVQVPVLIIQRRNHTSPPV
ncbi:MAG TPA: hypothetical protein VH186_14040 [Chloroflexia bacterium]|nr:hypothetical protein [Chloroflexia bacterium]